MGELSFYSIDDKWLWPGDENENIKVTMYNDVVTICSEINAVPYKELEQIYLKAKQEGRI